MDFNDPPIDFVKLAESLGVTARRVVDVRDLDGVLAESIACRETTLIDVWIDSAL